MEWKAHLVTKFILETLQKRYEMMKEELVYASDRVEFKQGYTAALNDFLNIDVREVLENEG